MPELFCNKCQQKITTWYYQGLDGEHPHCYSVYTCSHCLIQDSVEKYQSTGNVDFYLSNSKVDLTQWPEVVVSLKTLGQILQNQVLELQMMIGAEMTNLLFKYNGAEFEFSDFPLSGNIVNYDGVAQVSFTLQTGNHHSYEFHRLSFVVHQCDEDQPWELTCFNGNQAGIEKLMASVVLAIKKGIKFDWVNPYR